MSHLQGVIGFSVGTLEAVGYISAQFVLATNVMKAGSNLAWNPNVVKPEEERLGVLFTLQRRHLMPQLPLTHTVLGIRIVA